VIVTRLVLHPFQEDFWDLTYTNVVRIWGDDSDDDGKVITRGAW